MIGGGVVGVGGGDDQKDTVRHADHRLVRFEHGGEFIHMQARRQPDRAAAQEAGQLFVVAFVIGQRLRFLAQGAGDADRGVAQADAAAEEGFGALRAGHDEREAAQGGATGAGQKAPAGLGEPGFVGVDEVERHAGAVGGAQDGGFQVTGCPDAEIGAPVRDERLGRSGGVGRGGVDIDARRLLREDIGGAGQQNMDVGPGVGQPVGKMERHVGMGAGGGVAPDDLALGTRGQVCLVLARARWGRAQV